MNMQTTFFAEPPSPALSIQGLRYISEYISLQEESDLIRIIDTQPWITELKRRVQHYGYRYYYKQQHMGGGTSLGPLPEWFQPYCSRLHQSGAFPALPDQVIINEYQTGQGIAPHVDRTRFDRTVASISLGSPCMMDFIHSETGEKTSLLLEPRSLLLLSDNVRYAWKHGIAPRKTDRYGSRIIQRSRRLSLTFRKLIAE
jgi:alkylated DNA repair dioxygenase AlkB